MSTVVTAAAGEWEPDARPVRWRAVRGTLAIRRAQIGLGLTVLVCLVAFVGPAVAPHGSTEFVAAPFSGPSDAAPLGTDFLGRDVLSRVLRGGISVVWMAFAATALAMVVGTLVGMAAAYVGGLAGSLVMRTMDALMAFPYIVLVLLFVSIVGPKLWLLVLMVAFAWVPVIARLVQGITLQVVSLEYVQAVEVIGVRRREILVREILPNLATPLMVQFGQYLTYSIGVIAGLSFLGFGVQPPVADWGLMVNENRQGLTVQPWGVVVPIVLIGVFSIGTNLLAEGYSRWLSGIDGEASS